MVGTSTASIFPYLHCNSLTHTWQVKSGFSSLPPTALRATLVFWNVHPETFDKHNHRYATEGGNGARQSRKSPNSNKTYFKESFQKLREAHHPRTWDALVRQEPGYHVRVLSYGSPLELGLFRCVFILVLLFLLIWTRAYLACRVSTVAAKNDLPLCVLVTQRRSSSSTRYQVTRTLAVISAKTVEPFLIFKVCSRQSRSTNKANSERHGCPPSRLGYAVYRSGSRHPISRARGQGHSLLHIFPAFIEMENAPVTIFNETTTTKYNDKAEWIWNHSTNQKKTVVVPHEQSRRLNAQYSVGAAFSDTEPSPIQQTFKFLNKW